jgi:uncharacterized phage infection (PIP) family protein YhgE
MQTVDDPEFLDALERIFATRGDIKTIVEYQQRLFNSLQELTANHRAVHDHVRTLTESHNRSQENTTALMQARQNLETLLRNLEQSHRQTRDEMRQAVTAINRVQQDLNKIPELESRLNRLERELEKQMDRLWQDDRQDDRKSDEQERRIRKLEGR